MVSSAEVLMRQGHTRRLRGNETETLELNGGEVASQYSRGPGHSGRGRLWSALLSSLTGEIPRQKESWEPRWTGRETGSVQKRNQLVREGMAAWASHPGVLMGITLTSSGAQTTE